ncbi:3-methyladenine DNA glycosylase [Sinomonas cyclohexanicum]|uniref:3-methyladenine DNA glycosylase n=1 Tax=Sinomonas cyclohexanicum TaxID=322009 RepID=A0ABN6FKC3_SINCY|nr:DNA-3-methyladenine glycosylase 2 family protein [Corynebacterium cyclohexanicum]BCT77249.1 3-methyladenine DNA glycosylase [Corynebacterium cyclohexanicum]
MKLAGPLPRTVAPSRGTADAEGAWDAPAHYSLAATCFPLQRGDGDPCFAAHPAGLWAAFSTAEGPASLLITHRTVPGQAGEVRVRAWGEGAASAVASAPAMLGLTESWAGFDDEAFLATLPHLVRESRRRNPGLRLPATGRMVDALVPTVLEQKVTTVEARRAYRYLVRQYGTPAPGSGTVAPAGLMVAPTAEAWLRIPSWEWHRAGVGPQRSATVMRALRAASGIERLSSCTAAEAAAALQTIPGIGVWTAAEVTQRTHADPDSVSVGDFHLAKFVGFALTGQRTDDAGMLRLLEPWRGQRQRVVRLLGLSGVRAPRYGARMTIQDHRRH